MAELVDAHASGACGEIRGSSSLLLGTTLKLIMDFGVLFLSFVQGVGEILPVSSSVNLHFFSKLFHIQNFSFSLKIALHAGSLVALLIYFRKDIFNIFKQKFSRNTYFFPLVVGTIPVVIFGYFARDFIKEFDSPKIMGISCVIFGILLFMADKSSVTKSHSSRVIPLGKSFIIGIFQAIAIFPGVSRLGICLTASRILNLSRKESIHFSLMLAIPSIFGSLSLEVLEAYKMNSLQNLLSNTNLYGALFTAITGIIFILPAVAFMTKKGFGILTLYRIIIGILIYFI